jgi:hypothetical protein
MLVLPHVVGVVAVPLNVTVLVPWDARKPEPVIVTASLMWAAAGVSEVSVGGTVNVFPALGTPLTVTTTGPVVVPAGAFARTCVELQVVKEVAVTPLKVTVLVPWVDPKFEPLMVTSVPDRPALGDNVEIVGVGRTVKLTPLLTCVATVTVTLPVAAPDGTGAAILVADQLVGVAVLLLKNLTVLVPYVAPKLVPFMVTLWPTPAEAGTRGAVIVGGGIELGIASCES